jgi:hypothetical protein
VWVPSSDQHSHELELVTHNCSGALHVLCIKWQSCIDLLVRREVVDVPRAGSASTTLRTPVVGVGYAHTCAQRELRRADCLPAGGDWRLVSVSVTDALHPDITTSRRHEHRGSRGAAFEAPVWECGSAAAKVLHARVRGLILACSLRGANANIAIFSTRWSGLNVRG